MNPSSPAPWVIGSNGASVKVVDSEGKAVCMLTPRRDQFNGDLIAAAPDLLDSLKLALHALENARIEYDYDGNPMDECDAGVIDAVDAIRAAIAKATGEAA